LLAKVINEAGYIGVETEPRLQPLIGEHFHLKSTNRKDEARSDIKSTGFWSRLRQAYFDIKVVSPNARSNAHKTSASLFRSAEKEKEREYKDRILNVERADFNPVVFSTSGGMSQAHLRETQRTQCHCDISGFWMASMSTQFCFAEDRHHVC
jgi:hypothetical protein